MRVDAQPVERPLLRLLCLHLVRWRTELKPEILKAWNGRSRNPADHRAGRLELCPICLLDTVYLLTSGAAGVPGLRRWLAIVAANAVASERQSAVRIRIEAERHPCAGKRDMTTGNVETRFGH